MIISKINFSKIYRIEKLENQSFYKAMETLTIDNSFFNFKKQFSIKFSYF